jgi:3-hydroxy acid dehydrogenase / malonic semialdehyde reductase
MTSAEALEFREGDHMFSVSNKIVFITGASSGIGESCAHAFAAQGARLLLCSRRTDRIQAFADELTKAHGSGAALAFQLDVRNQPAVEKAVSELPAEWQEIEILVNNAGLSRGLDKLHEGQLQDWEEMIDTNIKGLLYISRAVIPGMVKRGKGHIINIGSLAGVEVYPGGNVYCATKHAVRALSTGMRMDLLGSSVRVTNIQPGMVETEFSVVRFHGDQDRAGKVYENLQPLSPDDIADLILFAATRPPHVDIAEMTVMPTAQASATLSYRGK